MEKSKKIDVIKNAFHKHKMAFIIGIVLIILLSAIVWIFSGFMSFLTTIVIAIVVGLLCSFVITFWFEDNKQRERDKIRNFKIENFIYTCADYLNELEILFTEITGITIDIHRDFNDIQKQLSDLKNKYNNNALEEIDDKYQGLVSEFIYSISPIYYNYNLLNSDILLVNDILNLDEYKFFANYPRNDIYKKFLNTKAEHEYFEGCSAHYIFVHLLGCFNMILDAEKLFPEIKIKYEELKKDYKRRKQDETKI